MNDLFGAVWVYHMVTVFFTFLTLYLAIHRSYHLPQTRIIMSLNRYTKLVVNFGLQSRKFSAVATMASCQAIRPQTPTGFQMHLLRSFHATTISLAKPKKGGNSKATDDGEGVPLPDVKQADARMEQQLSTLSAELAKFKIGKASTETFNNIQVEGFGTVVSAGQITLKSASKVEIAVYDPSMVKAVRDAIKDSGLGVNPQVEGNLVLVNIPKPSKESRDSMVKAASKVAEQVTVMHRTIYFLSTQLALIAAECYRHNTVEAECASGSQGVDGRAEEVQRQCL